MRETVASAMETRPTVDPERCREKRGPAGHDEIFRESLPASEFPGLVRLTHPTNSRRVSQRVGLAFDLSPYPSSLRLLLRTAADVLRAQHRAKLLNPPM